MKEPRRSKWPIILTFLAGILVGAILYRAGTTATLTDHQTATAQTAHLALPGQPANDAEPAPAVASARTAPAVTSPEPIVVPSDPGATYELIEWRRMPNGHRMAMTKRVGPSGTTFTRREIDCQGMRFRYLGEGDSLEEARLDRPSVDLGPLTPESISTYVSQHVCAK